MSEHFFPIQSLRESHYAHEPEGVAGQELHDRFKEILEADPRLTPENREALAERLQQLEQKLAFNQPVIGVANNMRSGPEIVYAGYVNSPLALEERNGEPVLNVLIAQRGYYNEWTDTELRYGVSSLVYDTASGFDRLFVGKDQISAWLQGQGLAMLHKEDPNRSEREHDWSTLFTLQKAAFSLEYMGLSDDQRQHLFTLCLERFLAGDDRQTLIIMEYIAGADTPVQQEQLADYLLDIIATHMPVGEASDTQVLPKVAALRDYGFRLPGMGDDSSIKPRTHMAAMVSEVYTRRARQLRSGEGASVFTQPAPRQPHLGPFPDAETLGVGVNFNGMLPEEVWLTVDHINALREEGRSLIALEDRYRRLFSKVLLEHLLNETHLNDPVNTPQVLDALAHLNMVTPENRGEYNKSLIKHILANLPLDDYYKIDAAHLAAVMRYTASWLQADIGSEAAHEPASDIATALFMAELYRDYSQQLLAEDMAKALTAAAERPLPRVIVAPGYL